jgi:hypothetical protein
MPRGAADNKAAIAHAGGIAPLVKLARTGPVAVKIEAIAALANLAVNGARTAVGDACWCCAPTVSLIVLAWVYI